MSDVLSKRLQKLFRLKSFECLVSDILEHGENVVEHGQNIVGMLERCREIGLNLNIQNGPKVDPEKVRAIVKMPVPYDAQGVQLFLGLVQYVLKSIQNLADMDNQQK